jgi:hypothetical protein
MEVQFQSNAQTAGYAYHFPGSVKVNAGSVLTKRGNVV